MKVLWEDDSKHTDTGGQGWREGRDRETDNTAGVNDQEAEVQVGNSGQAAHRFDITRVVRIRDTSDVGGAPLRRRMLGLVHMDVRRVFFVEFNSFQVVRCRLLRGVRSSSHSPEVTAWQQTPGRGEWGSAR